VIFGFGFKDLGLCRIVNDYVIEKVKQFPCRLIGFCVVPAAHRHAKNEIERCHDAGLKGVGELFPSGQNMHIDNAKITGRWTAICAERGLPVLLHTNEPVGHYYPGKTSTTLAQIETFIRNNQQLKIILAHWGGGFFFYEMMAELHALCKNVYYDCAASPLLYAPCVYKSACVLGLQNKILFGSDYPLLPISRYLSEIDASKISLEDKALLLGENAATLFS
jgi:predicted TIM-barrel fold metal-dependent hydrolase